MFKNYVKTAVRSLLRHRFFSAINIFGLSVAMALSMVIIMLVADQMNYDRYNSKRDRIYRVNSTPIGSNGERRNETATTTLPLKQELLENHTGVEKAVRIMRGFGNLWIEIGQNVNIPVAGYFADPEILEMFEYELEYGNPETALVEPYSVVLTKKSAKKLFRQENPLGELFKVGEEGPYKVTGVLKENTNKSHIVFDALASLSTVRSLEAQGSRGKNLDNWYNYTAGWVYVLLEKAKTPDDLQQSLNGIAKKQFTVLPKPESQQKVSYSLQSLMNITPGAFINNPIGPFLPWIFVYFFIALAALVMLTSCFNFTNLSIARSLTRAREIGVRKVTGAMRWQIFMQFLSESIIVALLALAGAFVLLIALKPLLLELSFARLLMWDLEINYKVFIAFVVFAVFVGILAGFFPAVILSGFQPIKVLKGLSSMRLLSGMRLRKTLLTLQFSFSLVFILSVIVVFNQLQFFLRADHGFNMDRKIVIGLSSTSATALKTELLKYSNIESVAGASHVLASGESKEGSYKRTLEDKDWISLDYYATDEDYLENLGIPMLAGKYYSAVETTSNESFIVLNEQAVKAFHFESNGEAIGQEIIIQQDSSKKKIIGVVKDYNHSMLMEKMEPLALTYNPKEIELLQVKYSGTYDDAGKSIEMAWAKVNPSLKVDYKDFYAEVHKIYDILFGDLVSILSVISFLAIVISCLGLLGMATYAIETRIREISIRKVLGASQGSLIYLLSSGFTSLLLLSILLAVPTAYWLNNLWLEKLAYHVSVDIGTVSIGILILIVFGVVTIGSQAWRALFINPVENLKSE
ncbi:MAG: ABC transporter permease [Bacteroidia bacterium]|nr:ABC transporter permease [Bacteroidia bacterium]